MDILEELFGEVVEDKIENIFEKAKSEPDSPVNLYSSITRKKGSKKIKLKLNKHKRNKSQSPIRIKIRDPSLFMENPKYKYTTIKITNNLYYSIDKWGYVFLNSSNFIPNTYILCKSYVNPLNKLQLLLDNDLILSDIKTPLTDEIKTYMGEKLYNSLMKSNKQLSKLFNKKIAIPFCSFKYNYHIKYTTNKHEIAIQILNKNNEDVSYKFESERLNINSWVIHEVEKFDKDFLIYRLRYHLQLKTNELNRLKKEKR